jgi:hypothetical protein
MGAGFVALTAFLAVVGFLTAGLVCAAADMQRVEKKNKNAAFFIVIVFGAPCGMGFGGRSKSKEAN